MIQVKGRFGTVKVITVRGLVTRCDVLIEGVPLYGGLRFSPRARYDIVLKACWAGTDFASRVV